MKFVRVVLVSPKYPRNIGMAARALANFGGEDLILVSPQCELTIEANEGAAEGQGPLRNARIYKDWDQFFAHEPDGLRLGFSRRVGKRRTSELFETAIRDYKASERPLFLIFGSEDKGLSLEDLDKVHRQVYFDLPGDVRSMNLSHAVVMGLQMSWSSLREQTMLPSQSSQPSFDVEPTLRAWLESLGLDLNTHTRWNALVATKQLLLRAAPTSEEWRRFESLIQQTVKKIQNKNES